MESELQKPHIGYQAVTIRGHSRACGTALGLGAIAIGLAICVGGCISKVIRSEADPGYLAVASKVFSLKRDAYLFREVDERKGGIYIGCISETPRTHIPRFPTQIDASLVGRRYRDFLILAVIPKGARFRVVGLKRKESFETTMTSFEIVLGGELSGKFGVIDGFWLTDKLDDHKPVIYEELAEQTRE